MATTTQYKDRTLIATIGDEVRVLARTRCLQQPSPACTLTSSPLGSRSRSPSQDTITGLLLAGTGHVDARGKKNFLVVDSSESSTTRHGSPVSVVIRRPRTSKCSSLLALTLYCLHQKRPSRLSKPPSPNTPSGATLPSSSSTSTWVTSPSLATAAAPHTELPLLQIADQIRPAVEKYHQAFPALLEIPSKDHPYGQSVPGP